MKRGGSLSTNWKRRWFVMTQESAAAKITYWKKKSYDESQAAGSFNLSTDEFSFLQSDLEERNQPFAFSIVTYDRTWVLACDSESDYNKWTRTIRAELPEADMKGWLEKWCYGGKWVNRYCVLRMKQKQFIYYGESSGQNGALVFKKKIDLSKTPTPSIEVSSYMHPHQFTIDASNELDRDFSFSCRDSQELEDWMRGLRKVTDVAGNVETGFASMSQYIVTHATEKDYATRAPNLLTDDYVNLDNDDSLEDWLARHSGGMGGVKIDLEAMAVEKLEDPNPVEGELETTDLFNNISFNKRKNYGNVRTSTPRGSTGVMRLSACEANCTRPTNSLLTTQTQKQYILTCPFKGIEVTCPDFVLKAGVPQNDFLTMIQSYNAGLLRGPGNGYAVLKYLPCWDYLPCSRSGYLGTDPDECFEKFAEEANKRWGQFGKNGIHFCSIPGCGIIVKERQSLMTIREIDLDEDEPRLASNSVSMNEVGLSEEEYKSQEFVDTTGSLPFEPRITIGKIESLGHVMSELSPVLVCSTGSLLMEEALDNCYDIETEYYDHPRNSTNLFV